MTEAVARPRIGARCIVLDPDGRVLLIHERIEVGTHWLTPGGGVEAGESLPVAAARELYEETGIAVELEEATEPVHVVRRLWHWRGSSWDQTDHYFVARLSTCPPIRAAALTAMEVETLLEMRWWTLAELRAAGETVIEPADLAELIERLGSADGSSSLAGR